MILDFKAEGKEGDGEQKRVIERADACSTTSRKLRADDHDAGLVPAGPTALRHGLQPRRHGPEHVPRHLECGAEH